MRECTFILFGATGDLAQRKLIPALYMILKKKEVTKLHIIGAAREHISATEMLNLAKKNIAHPDETTWKELETITHYQHLDINNQEDFQKLNTLIENIEKQNHLIGNRLLYCAVPSTLFAPITDHAHKAKIITCKKNNDIPWQRIVYEKPFGRDYASAKKLNAEIHHCLDEEQIYRIDHYLAKELVSNIALVRFTNRLFEPQWNHHDIESIEIRLQETIGVDHRIEYFDQYGLLRDIVQNHMLELMALIAMEPPTTITGADLQEKRAEVLKNITFDGGILGQYEGYTQAPGVAPDSKTETFAALTLFINNDRWHGVPFYLKTGKCLNKKEKNITLTFKPEKCRLTEGCPLPRNTVTIAIAPDAGFSVELNIKKPGKAFAITPVKMEFCHECLFGVYTPEAYEVILTDVINGERGISVRFDEIEATWKIIDEIYAAHLPLYSYTCGSSGPEMEK